VPSPNALPLIRTKGLVDGDGVKDDRLYWFDHGLVLDAIGRGAGSAAFTIRGVDPNNLATEVFRVDKDGTVSYAQGLTLAGQLQLTTQGSGGGVLIGGDALLYRSAADTLSTGAGDGLVVAGALTAQSGLGITGDLTVTGGAVIAGTASPGTGRMYKTAAGGLTLQGIAGSGSDFNLVGAGGGNVFDNPTGTVNGRFYGNVYINDDSNASATLGFTVNQGAADDAIISRKSSDVAHGMTSIAETDTYGYDTKATAANGGLRMTGMSAGTRALYLVGFHTTDDTAKSIAGDGAVMVAGAVKSGTSVADQGANANILVVRNNGTTRFILDADGDGHADVSWVTYDAHDDLALIADIEGALLSREMAEDPTGTMTERRKRLEETGVINAGSWHVENGHPRAMVNFTRLAMLHHGALIRVADRFAELEARLAAAESRLALEAP
jgi:hypothetical protein